MLNIHLTLPQVVGFLRTIAEGEPTRIGQGEGGSCVYADSDDGMLTPVCIIGQMFANLGLLRLLLTDPNELFYPNMLGACGIDSDFWSYLARYGVTADLDAKEFAHSVQRTQDDGIPWGEAFNNAVTKYRESQQADLDHRLNNLFG